MSSFRVGRRAEKAFLRRYPAYSGTAVLDRLRGTEYRHLDAEEHCYLDYTGSGLVSDAQLRAQLTRLRSSVYGNPHSDSPSSTRSTELVEAVRGDVLRFFRADPDEYVVIFTSNATGACRLVGEAFPFGPNGRLLLTQDNHNSVVGIREYARNRGAALGLVHLAGPEMRIPDEAVLAALDSERRGPRLFAYPAQSNFTGVRHPLEWAQQAQRLGWRVLLDAAAFAPTNPLDLSVHKPDFVPVSWYKVFGYPTGVGALVARRDAVEELIRPWFSGGTIWGASTLGDWHRLDPAPGAFEDGTLNFLQLPDVSVGLRWISQIGMGTIHTRVRCLTGWLLDALGELRHGNGAPMVLVYGPRTTEGRGGTIAFNFLTPDGELVDERLVSRESAAAGISLRTGCFCNPGAGEAALSLSVNQLATLTESRMSTVDDYLDAMGVPNGGGVRVSLGLASTFADVRRFVDWSVSTYRDRVPDRAGLPPRLHC
ncbi:aminotransferase class V-fold PLP-dependent enzyme [Allokutzneria sp. A3M-2-11 16]|uniref:aminotransferase class V-fold PLP-dependent enzyme n=1 Tax=Allokutzneria sp. A3M-2-11 16 TaxID=2962043 RepID=UPI0020B7CFE4|nr:aminotransferase class V-fold PLP-dependent enzyme [Allokutzneria sp. A3M-2-11 16]MCP3803571.1 aminotransferase class V-fold PLP-dependent enzyme [Allokutzneria sp. A3M-2-11 16]